MGTHVRIKDFKIKKKKIKKKKEKMAQTSKKKKKEPQTQRFRAGADETLLIGLSSVFVNKVLLKQGKNKIK